MSLIPRIVWSYYHDLNKMPEFYRNCISTWVKHIPPHWQVYLLDESTVTKYLDCNKLPLNFSKLIPQRKSDCIRLELLSTHGGVWMDVGIILNDNLEKLIPNDPKVEYVGYYLNIFLPSEPHDNIKDAVVENWFIATTPNYLITKWRDYFFEILNQHDESNIHLAYPYKDHLTQQQIENFLYKHYLLMHVLYQYLLIHDDDFRTFHKTKTLLRPAEETALFIQSKSGWKSSKIKKYYDNYFTKEIKSDQPLLKVRGVDFTLPKSTSVPFWLIFVIVVLLLMVTPLPLVESGMATLRQLFKSWAFFLNPARDPASKVGLWYQQSRKVTSPLCGGAGFVLFLGEVSDPFFYHRNTDLTRKTITIAGTPLSFAAGYFIGRHWLPFFSVCGFLKFVDLVTDFRIDNKIC